MKASDVQIGGDHYKGKGIQPIEFILSNDLGFIEGNVIKYIFRWKHKRGLEDLEKARHYIDLLIESLDNARNGQVHGEGTPEPAPSEPRREGFDVT